MWRRRKRGDTDSKEEEWVEVDEGASREAEDLTGGGAVLSERGGGRGGGEGGGGGRGEGERGGGGGGRG